MRIDGKCRTSLEGVYAVGDAANPLGPTLSSAVGMGATAAKAAYAYIASPTGIAPTLACMNAQLSKLTILTKEGLAGVSPDGAVLSREAGDGSPALNAQRSQDFESMSQIPNSKGLPFFTVHLCLALSINSKNLNILPCFTISLEPGIRAAF